MTPSQFIGGPLHGELRSMPNLQLTYRVALPNPDLITYHIAENAIPEHVHIEMGHYSRHEMKTGSGPSSARHFIYVYEGSDSEIRETARIAKTNRLLKTLGIAWNSMERAADDPQTRADLKAIEALIKERP